MSLSVIIVNFKTANLVIDCLHSLALHEEEMEVIVVDNCSGDGSEQAVRAAFPSVKWLQMSYNSGFARGNNEGIRIASGDTILLLNSDTLDKNRAVMNCYRRLSESDYIAAGVQLLNADGSPQISGNFFMKGGLNHLMALPYTGRLIRWLGMKLKVKKTNVPEARGLVEVDWINGAFLMVKRDAVNAAGLLDEDFFLYSEEIEWCSRLRRLGKMCIYGDLNVIHLEGGSANKAFDSKKKGYQHLSDRKGRQVMVSGLLRIRKQYGIGWFLFHLAGYLFTIPVYLLIVLLKTILFRPGQEWKLWWGYTRNTMVLLKHFFLMLFNRKHFYKVL